MDSFLENYLDTFLLKNENDKLLNNKIDKKAGVIKEGDSFFSVPIKATGVAKGQEIGYGHVITPAEIKNGIVAMNSTGEQYLIPYSSNIKLNKKQAKDVARNDANNKRKVTKKQVKNFDSLPQQLQMIATDINFNVEGGLNTFSNLKEAIETLDSDRMKEHYKRYTNVKRNKEGEVISKDPLKNRNKDTLALITSFDKEYPKMGRPKVPSEKISDIGEVEVAEAEPPKSFKQAFAEARANKDAEFTYGGDRYNTRLKGETPQQYAAFLGKDMPVRVARKGGMVIKNYKERT